MLDVMKKSAAGVAALAAFGLGGSALAGAANTKKQSNSSTTTRQQQRPQRETLSDADAAKVKAAALDKVPGATVLRTEAGGPYGTPYHAHIKTTDGKLQVVLVNASFEATAVQADNQRGGPGGPGGRHGGPGGPGGPGGETPLTGDTKDKVEAAVKGRYPGATIVRTETNNASDAPYESHITTTDGKELEVLVSKDFAVVKANERPARP